MTDIVARYTLAFRDLASRGILRTANSARALSRGLESASRRAAAVSAAVVGAATLVNQSTAEQANLAASVGKTVAELQGLTGVAKSIGLGFDNVVDIQEEVINKFGEMAAAGEIPKTAIEGLTGLGFAAKEFLDVAARADINELIDRGLQSVASGARTVADVQSALDQIAGGEANKILGAALARNATSVAELNAHYERLNFLTKEGETGAAIYTRRFSDLKFTLTSLSREGFGQLGAAMAPAIENLTDFLVANKAVINAGMSAAITAIGDALANIDWSQVTQDARAIGDAFGDVIKIVGDFIDITTAMTGPMVDALGDAVKYIADEFNIDTFAGFEDSSNLAIAAAALMALKVAGSLGQIVTGVGKARKVIGKGIVIGVAVAGIAEAFEQINKVIARKAELEGKGVDSDAAGRLSIVAPLAAAADYAYSNAIRPIGEKYLLPLEHAAFDALGLKPREVDFDAYENAATKALTEATKNAVAEAANAARVGIYGPQSSPVTPPAISPISPVAIDRQLERAREVTPRPVEVEVTTKVEGRIDGAEITRTETNTVRRDSSGSNMPLRSRAGRTGDSFR